MQNRTGVGGAWIELRGASSCYQPSRQPGRPNAPPSIFMRHEISSSIDEQQSPQCGLVPPPLPSPGSAGGSHGHEYNIEVKAEAVAGAMCEPQNTHPRKAADAALAMIKLAHVAPRRASYSSTQVFFVLRLLVGVATLVRVPYVAGFRRQEKRSSTSSWFGQDEVPLDPTSA